MILKEDKCFCEGAVDRPNEKDECSKCVVQGCLSCAAGDEYECVTCQEGLTLLNGDCACPVDGHMLNGEGECEECQVEGCAACVNGNSQQCARCKDCSASLIDGTCECRFNDATWLEGMCVSEHEANTSMETRR